MDSKDAKNETSQDEHVIFIDRLVDFHIQNEKNKDSSKEKNEEEKTPKK